MLNRRVIMYLRMFKIRIIVVSLVIGLIIWAIIGMSRLEPFYRRMQIAQMPFMMLMQLIYVSIFIFGYLYFLSVGFAKFDKAPIK